MGKKVKNKQPLYFRKVNKFAKDIDAEIEENNKYRQGRSRKQWQKNYVLQDALLIGILIFCFFILAELFYKTFML